MSTSTPAPAVPASNLTTLIAIYEAFGRGDIPSQLGLLSDDVRFEASEPPSTAAAAGHPLLSVRQGKGEVAGFFTEVGRCELHSFDILHMFSGDGQAAVHVRIDLTTPAGIRIVDDEMHRWEFDDAGRAVSMKHYADTAKHLAAWFPER